MRISEFVRKLQAIEREFGDLPVIVDDPDYGASYLVPQALQLIDSCDYLRPELTPVGLALCILKPET